MGFFKYILTEDTESYDEIDTPEDIEAALEKTCTCENCGRTFKIQESLDAVQNLDLDIKYEDIDRYAILCPECIVEKAEERLPEIW